MATQPAKPKKSTFRKIVNVFLYFFIGLIVFILLLLGFTQTKTFREVLRTQVISQVNSSINGKLNIEEIDGTIFTSLTLRNTSLLVDNDTLLFANKLAVKTSPLQLLLKRIYVRSLELADAKINLIKDSNGVYNFSKLSKPKPKDTTSSSFPFTITVADLRLNNISLKNATWENSHSIKSYPALNMNDMRIDSLYLALNAFADMNNHNYQLKISGSRAKVNLQNFRLRDLRGNFYLTDHNAKVDYLVLRTNTTDLDLYASMEKLNLFGNFQMADLKNSPISVELNARMFDFADLSSFATTDFLKGTLKTKFKATGTFGNISLDQLSLDYLQTHLKADGIVRNLQKPRDMYIKVSIKDSYINQPDIAELMPGGKIPVYKNLQIKNINIDFDGKPNNFKTILKMDLPEGSVSGTAALDFSSPKMKYDVNLKTEKLNVEPFANISTFLNTNITVKGEGIQPNDMNAQVQLRLNDSKFREYLIDSLKLNAVADNGRIIMRLASLARNAGINVDGNLDIRDRQNPVYNISGNVANLDLNKFVTDTSMVTNLNFGFNLTGRSFDFHKMESNFKLALAQSTYKNKTIDPMNLEVAYTRPAANERLITLNSDFMDMNVRGNYSIDDAAAIVGYESKIITQSILQKVYEFNPMALFNDSLKAKEFEIQVNLDKTKIPKIIAQDMYIDYTLNIKDFKLISMFTGVNKIDMDGTIGGTITNDARNFSASSNIDLKYLKMLTPSNLIYISNLGFKLDVSRGNSEVSFDNVAANMKLTTERIFSGTDLKNILVEVNLKNNLLNFNVASEMDTTLKAQIAGIGDMTRNQFRFAINKFMVDYKKVELVNDSALVAIYSKDSFEIQHFALIRNGSRISMMGSLLGNGSMRDLRLKIDNLDASLIKELAGLNANVSANLNMLVTMNGYLDKPLIKVDLDIDKITAEKIHLGNLQCNLDYAEKLLKADIVVLDSAYNKSVPLLTIAGNIPIDLGFMGVTERLQKGQPITASLKSNNFDLASIGGLVPFVKGLSGKLIADLNVGGTTDKFNYGGHLTLSNASFLLKENNLSYGMDMDVSLANESISIDNLTLKNTGQTKYQGTLSGNGKINFSGTTLQNIDAVMSGSLAVLSPSSKAALPVYGDLVVQSDGNWNFTYNNGASDFTGTILLKNTDLTVVPVQASYGRGKDDYIYHYVIDSSKFVDKKQVEFNKIVALSQKYSPSTKTRAQQNSSFNYDLNIKIDNEAKIVVIVNKEFNQQLTAILNGDLTYGSNGVTQGEFKLLEGSNLTFFQTFETTGTIYFESELTNPRLDLVATYVGDHNATVDSGKVAVKIKLQGSVQELGQKLANNQNNISVYVGESNIQNDVPSPKYNAADAISFIISGKFPPELTANERTQQGNALAGYGTSLLGSLVSSFANSQLGDVVKSIELEQRGSQYRFGISGKLENLRYSIGGTTEALQDFSKANIKFEYPFNQNFLMRFERKDPIVETTGINEKINELALRYKFIF